MALSEQDFSFSTSRVYPRVNFYQHRIESLAPRYQRIVDTLPECLKREEEAKRILDDAKINLDTPPRIIVRSNVPVVKDDVAWSVKDHRRYHHGKAQGNPDLAVRVEDTPIASKEMTVVVFYVKCPMDQLEPMMREFLCDKAVIEDLNNILILVDLSTGVIDPTLFKGQITEFVRQNTQTNWNGCNQVHLSDGDESFLKLQISNHLERKFIAVFNKADLFLRSYLRQHHSIPAENELEEQPFNKSSLVDEINSSLSYLPGLSDLYVLARKDDQIFLQEIIKTVIQRALYWSVNYFSNKFSIFASFLLTIAMNSDIKFETLLREEIAASLNEALVRKIIKEVEKFKGKESIAKAIEVVQSKESGQALPPKKIDELEYTTTQFKGTAIIIVDNMEKILTEMKTVCENLKKTLRLFEKLRFELKGTLKSSSLMEEEDDDDEGRHTKLPSGLQEDLLKVKDVYGCGTIYGVFEIHVTKLDKEVKKELWTVINKHNYPYHYRVAKVTKQAEPYCQHVSGKRIKRESDSRVGTLGGFLEDKGKKEMYAISCAHVVHLEPNTSVQIHTDDGLYEGLGFCRSDLSLGSGNNLLPLIDFAAVKVHEDVSLRCVSLMKNDRHEQCRSRLATAAPGFEELRFSHVYKHGAASGLTCGSMCSSNYFCRMNEKFHCDYLIYLESEVDVPDQAPVFAIPGDSGSVICASPLNIDGVLVLSMLTGGDMKIDGDRTPKYLSFQLSRAITALNQRAGVQLDIPESSRV